MAKGSADEKKKQDHKRTKTKTEYRKKKITTNKMTTTMTAAMFIAVNTNNKIHIPCKYSLFSLSSLSTIYSLLSLFFSPLFRILEQTIYIKPEYM